MSTVDRPTSRTLPPLVEGERLDRATFHERYEAMPPGTWAELIGGVVYMSSPVGPPHGRKTSAVMGWLFHYEQFTPGVEFLDKVSTALSDIGEVQPDALLRILPQCGGGTRSESAVLVGAPELVLEVAITSQAIDLGIKKLEYERAGVLEYIVLTTAREGVAWHRNADGTLMKVPPDGDGIFRSQAFPGLWLDPQALYERDLKRLISTLDLGLATPEHKAFATRLAAALAGP